MSAKTKGMRARRMWGIYTDDHYGLLEIRARKSKIFKNRRVAVIDVSDGEALVRRIEDVIDMLPPCCSNRDIADAVAKDLNLIDRKVKLKG